MPMRFPHLKAARVKLQERKNACLKSTYESAERYIGFFLDFLRTDPIVRTISAELFTIAQQKFSEPSQLVDSYNRCLVLPDNQIECAAYHLRLLEIMGTSNDEVPHFRMIFGKGSNRFQDMFDDFFGQTIVPLHSFIDERIDDGDLMLYMLSRYQRECNWFESKTLTALVSATDSKKLEENLDQHLRSWLFQEGVDYPFSTPRSPSGRADVIVWQGEEPLPIEVKVYDGVHRDLGHVSQGMWQAQRYAHDYGKAFGYLVVFNTSPHLLAFENNIAPSGPPCVEVGGINVHAITIDIGDERASASKEKPLATKVVKTPTSS